MKTIFSIFAAWLLTTNLLFGQQARFVTSGIIEYDKTVNTYALIKKGQLTGKNIAGNEQQLLEQYQKEHPQFKVLKSTLTFSGDKTLFTPAPAPPETAFGIFMTLPMAEQNNTIYSDLMARMLIAQKQILGETFLLKDSTRKINWKITDETREIAGYTCRRANALVFDSIYVVAFYTEKIHVSGGPESFSGLPGMILELAIPHENVVWLATKVTDAAPASDTVTPPKRGKPVDHRQLLIILSEAVKGRDARVANLIMKINLL